MTQPRDARGRFVSTKVGTFIVGKACSEGCCNVIRDYAYNPSVMSEEQYVRPMYQVLEPAGGENVYFYWDTERKSYVDEDGDLCDSGGNKIDRSTAEGRRRLGLERSTYDVLDIARAVHEQERRREEAEEARRQLVLTLSDSLTTLESIDIRTLSDREIRELRTEEFRRLRARNV